MENKETTNIKYSFEMNELNINKYGAFSFPFKFDVLQEAGFNKTDMVKITIAGREINCPIVPSYNYVDSGSTGLFMHGYLGTVDVAMIGGQLATRYNLAQNVFGKFVLEPDITFPINVTIELVKKEGFKTQFEMFDSVFSRRTKNREDYSCSDEEYANFRNVVVGRIKPYILYRSSSPIDKYFKRNKYADEAMRKNRIKNVINLTDYEQDVNPEKFEYDDSYYKTCNVLFLGMPTDYYSKTFRDGIATAIRFVLFNRPGPTLIHCMEGKDRTGFVIAIIEALMGATRQQICYDYFTSFVNFFRVERNSFAQIFLEAKILDYLTEAFGKPFNDQNAESVAEEYLESIGLTKQEIKEFKQYLGDEKYIN